MVIKSFLFLVTLAIGMCYCDAQVSVDLWKQKYNSYYAGLSGHKIDVTFNQSKYTAGDTAFFSIRLFENDLHLVAPKRILDFHVIDSEGKRVFHFLVSVINGIGHNQWLVPDLPSGIYRIAIHHYGLKTYNPEVIFQYPLEIVNSLSLQPINESVRITVEGGHLIAGVEERILIATVPLVPIKLIDERGALLASASSDRDGFCVFSLRPFPIQKYFILVGSDTIRKALPIVEADGVSLSVKFKNETNHSFGQIKAPQNSRFKGEKLFLVVSQRGRFLEANEFEIQNDSIEIDLQSARWDEGIIHLSILRSNGEELAFRNFYHQPQIRIKPKINLIKTNYRPREDVDITFEIKDSNGIPQGSVFSVTIQTKQFKQAKSWQALHDPSFDIDFVNEDFAWNEVQPEGPTTLDHHVLTRTKPQPWLKILAGIHHMKDFRFKGNIQHVGIGYSDRSKKPLPTGTAVLFYLQRSHQRYQVAITDGSVVLPMADFFGLDEILMIAETQVYMAGEAFGQVIPDFWVDWNTDTIKWPTSSKVKQSIFSDSYSIEAKQNKLIRKSFDAFLSKNDSNSDKENQASIVPASDISITLADYDPFVDMEDLIREIIPSLQHRKTRKGPVVMVSLPYPLKVTGDPTYIIDGFATKNTAYFMSLKPSDISTISVVSHPKKLIPLGLLGKNGLVIVQTKKGNTRPNVDKSLLLEGLGRPATFSGVSNRKDEKSPRFSSLAYWNPSCITDSNGMASLSFITMDGLGPYQISVKGISQTGKPFYVTDEIEVSLSSKK